MIVDDMNWISIPELTEPIHIKAKIRYRHAEQPVTVSPMEDGRVKLVFDEPQRAAAIGQAAVLYDGDVVVGGGTIVDVPKAGRQVRRGMKFLIASDIHGSAYYCEQLLQAFEREQAARLLLLGDILYHGPRKRSAARLCAPKKVIAMLNGMADTILCVRGNCDTEVDQMVLAFPIPSRTMPSCRQGAVGVRHARTSIQHENAAAAA